VLVSAGVAIAGGRLGVGLDTAKGASDWTEVSAPTTDTGTGELPPEQEGALRAAVEHGYYETPRAADLGDLADILDVPRSTLAYRLRRAEAHLAERYTGQRRSTEGAPTPL